MTRHLFILSRRDPDLYEYLKERFADDRAVEVILDRRRTPGAIRPDRRQRPDADAELLARSYTIVTIGEGPMNSSCDSGPRESSRASHRLSARFPCSRS